MTTVANIFFKGSGKSIQEGFIPENPNENPFEIIATRAPLVSDIDSVNSESSSEPKKHFRNLNDYYKYRHEKYRTYREHAQNGLLYRVWPITHPKDSYYCPNMRAMFAYTCQPSKPLRLDLVEFCKDYSAFCNVPNFHRLPGPRIGPPVDNSIGHVGVTGRFGLGIGALPGFDVGYGWGVDVGPIPGLGEDIGVGLGLDLGIVGAKSPEAFRRGQDNPNEKGSGVVGISGGVGVDAPGGGNVGVGSGLGVGR
ncbi:hypothetical protein KIN20_019020 [Parelaphostrongylus tenuis]|uniref:Uncharacterized protein n=1 Tax=Parelaphostrongylus tenuis TaxID=148309 RepID=A0AAD5N4C2_PARTN|nr:hypothetical protein KIN20_019020 [Parelaphostrongylus tenuis]